MQIPPLRSVAASRLTQPAAGNVRNAEPLSPTTALLHGSWGTPIRLTDWHHCPWSRTGHLCPSALGNRHAGPLANALQGESAAVVRTGVATPPPQAASERLSPDRTVAPPSWENPCAQGPGGPAGDVPLSELDGGPGSGCPRTLVTTEAQVAAASVGANRQGPAVLGSAE